MLKKEDLYVVARMAGLKRRFFSTENVMPGYIVVFDTGYSSLNQFVLFNKNHHEFMIMLEFVND